MGSGLGPRLALLRVVVGLGRVDLEARDDPDPRARAVRLEVDHLREG